MVGLRGRSIPPSSGRSSPTISRHTVLLPAPFGPTSPTFSPALIWNEASTNRICPPYCFVTFEKAITRARLIASVGRRRLLATLSTLGDSLGSGLAGRRRVALVGEL